MTVVSVYKLGSVLLQYPTTALFEGLDTLSDAVAAVPSAKSRRPLADLLGWLGRTDPTEVAQHYVETFDLRRRCALYLTYFRCGDTRKRGMAILGFKAAYRQARFEPAEDELADYLPLVLEFADLAPDGVSLLRRHRADLELLRRALLRAESPYAGVLDAVCEQLPGPDRRDLVLIRKYWESGPPHEDVGLEPFAPPEYLRGQEARR